MTRSDYGRKLLSVVPLSVAEAIHHPQGSPRMHMTWKSRTAILVTAAATLLPAGVAAANTSSSSKVQSPGVVGNAEESQLPSCFQIARPASATGTATVSFAAVAPTAAAAVA